MKDYYEGKYVCCENSCGKETRTLHEANKCVVTNCNSKLKPAKIGEKGVADTFNYLERLFDFEKKPKVSSEQQRDIDLAVAYYKPVYENLKMKVLQAREHNAYDKIHLASVFDFMHNNQMKSGA